MHMCSNDQKTFVNAFIRKALRFIRSSETRLPYTNAGLEA